ncbi:MAG: AAA family ATPase [Candidatus Thermoplasmatota archaeon]|nr:AAA family ATPase [Arenicellales bacterium]MED5158920.1 AAA family ATPase [Candidatus Thermoplasmatota archaeon]
MNASASQTGVCGRAAPNMSNNDVSTSHMMADYLDRIGAGKVLLDRAPFSFDWTPPALVGRDSELRELASMFIGMESHGVGGRAVITGPVGSGKTVITRRFGEDLQRLLDGRRKIVLAHVNCRNHPTTSQVLQQIALSLDSGHPERGFSSGEIVQSIRRNLNSHESHLLLVLDEVDVLIRREKSDLIYKLLRIDEGQDQQGSLSLILVSQDASMLKLFEAAIISRLGESNILDLQPYDEPELVGIARQRYEEACRPGSVGDETLAKIGRFASDSGDARLAIELLEAAVRRAEKDGRGDVLVEDVRPSTLRAASVEPSQVDNLGRHQKLVLLGICRRLKKVDEISSGDAQKLYNLVCEEFGARPRSYTTFWKHLKVLETQGLIETRTANASVGRGRTQHITMTNTAPAVLESRIEKEFG